MTDGLDVIVRFLVVAILIAGVLIGLCAGVALMGCNSQPTPTPTEESPKA